MFYGDFAALIATFSLLAAVYFNKRTWLALACIIASGSALIAVALSGSRNALFAAPILMLLATWLYFNKHKHWISLSVILVLFSSAAVSHQLWPNILITKRINHIYTDVLNYQSGTQSNNPIGLRFDLWKASWEMFRQKPILGSGVGNFQNNIELSITQGKSPNHLAQLNQAHNSYLHALSTKGVPGLLTLLALLGIPIVHFCSLLRSTNNNLKLISIAAICTAVGYAIFGLTESIFTRSIMLNTYVTFMALFYFFQQQLNSSLPHFESGIKI